MSEIIYLCKKTLKFLLIQGHLNQGYIISESLIDEREIFDLRNDLDKEFEEYKDEHIAAYGPDNHLRLTGLHETQSIDKFSWGIADRGASIRVPHSFANAGYKGYLEDRRPNSQGDPYNIVSRVLKTEPEVEKDLK